MSRYAHLAFTDTGRRLQRAHGSDRAYAGHLDDPAEAVDELGENETAFLSSRDGFYLGTVGETGWPYVQYRKPEVAAQAFLCAVPLSVGDQGGGGGGPSWVG